MIPMMTPLVAGFRLQILSRFCQRSFHRQSFVGRAQSSSNDPEDGDVKRDVPIKYTTSKAHDHRSFDTFLTPARKAPWYQTYIILASTSVFMIYFFILREENDIDDELGKPLFDRIPGLEEKSLVARLNNARMYGHDTTKIELELKQLRERK